MEEKFAKEQEIKIRSISSSLGGFCKVEKK